MVVARVAGAGPPEARRGGPGGADSAGLRGARLLGRSGLAAAAVARLLPADLDRDLAAVRGYVVHVQRDSHTRSTGAAIRRLGDIQSDLDRLTTGGPVEHPAVAALRPLVSAGMPVEVPRRLVAGALVDQAGRDYPSFDHLTAHCDLVANPIGTMLLWAMGRATPDRVIMSDRICTGIRLLGYCNGIGVDSSRGRVYLPVEDLRRFEVDVNALRASSAGHAAQALLAFESTRALAWIDAGAPIVSTLRGWARLIASSCIAQGRALAQALADGGYDPLTARPQPQSVQVAGWWLRAVVGRAG